MASSTSTRASCHSSRCASCGPARCSRRCSGARPTPHVRDPAAARRAAGGGRQGGRRLDARDQETIRSPASTVTTSRGAVPHARCSVAVRRPLYADGEDTIDVAPTPGTCRRSSRSPASRSSSSGSGGRGQRAWRHRGRLATRRIRTLADEHFMSIAAGLSCPAGRQGRQGGPTVLGDHRRRRTARAGGRRAGRRRAVRAGEVIRIDDGRRRLGDPLTGRTTRWPATCLGQGVGRRGPRGLRRRRRRTSQEPVVDAGRQRRPARWRDGTVAASSRSSTAARLREPRRRATSADVDWILLMRSPPLPPRSRGASVPTVVTGGGRGTGPPPRCASAGTATTWCCATRPTDAAGRPPHTREVGSGRGRAVRRHRRAAGDPLSTPRTARPGHRAGQQRRVDAGPR